MKISFEEEDQLLRVRFVQRMVAEIKGISVDNGENKGSEPGGATFRECCDYDVSGSRLEVIIDQHASSYAKTRYPEALVLEKLVKPPCFALRESWQQFIAVF